jgi:hypothetical protein
MAHSREKDDPVGPPEDDTDENEEPTVAADSPVNVDRPSVSEQST